jgi:hypothetical protein
MRYLLWRGLGGVVGVSALIGLAAAIGLFVTRFDLMPR